MGSRKEVGTVYLPNPGVISHNETLALYKKHVDPSFEWQTFSGPELLKVIAAARSNNKLATTRLETLFPEVTPIQEAVERTLITLAKSSEAGNVMGNVHSVGNTDGSIK
jgi:3,5-epimerase/4-reductase